jgi:hypothetical protein
VQARFQDFKISRFQDFKISRFQDFKISTPPACFVGDGPHLLDVWTTRTFKLFLKPRAFKRKFGLKIQVQMFKLSWYAKSCGFFWDTAREGAAEA